MTGRFAPRAVRQEWSLDRDQDAFYRYHISLATKRRGRRVGGGSVMLARPVGLDHSRPWNKGLLVGQKKPSNPNTFGPSRSVEIARMWRDLALFNLAIDSQLRACDLVNFVSTKYVQVRGSGIERQSFTGRRADQCNSKITDQTRASLEVWFRSLRATDT
jgi:hypothetical protein